MAKKIPLPLEYRLTLDHARLFLYWQHRQGEGDDVYKRTFCTPLALDDFLADRYGKAFARKVRPLADKLFAEIRA